MWVFNDYCLRDCDHIIVFKCRVKMEIDVPVGVAYKLYSDRESIPRWMPFISSVQVCNNFDACFFFFSFLLMLR